MLFHTFSTQEERKKFGGSFFIELQYCRLAQGTAIEKIISVSAIENWKNDSLYIHGDNDNLFLSYYKKIFTNGIYNNRKSGMIDIYGINYYSQKATYHVIKKVTETQPLDYQVLLNWLENTKEYIGFYILGL